MSPVTGGSYGLATVCRVWRMARSGVYRDLAPAPAPPPRRRGPIGAMSDAALTAAIRDALAASPFHGEGNRFGLDFAMPESARCYGAHSG